MIEITAKAKEKILEYLAKEEKDTCFRLYVEAGGCSGFQYGLAMDQKQENDQVIPFDGFTAVLDPMSSEYLKDAVIDYSESLHGSGFNISNPNAKSNCGCGKSFQS